MKEVKKESKTKSTVSKKTKVSEEKKEVKVKSTKKKNTEVKTDKALLNKKDQHNYKVLCKVINIVVKIFRICLMIFIPFIILSMVIIPFIFKKVEVSANILKINDDISFIVRENGISAKIGDKVHVINCNTLEFDHVMTFLTNNSKSSIITHFEVLFLILAIIVILAIYMLSYIERLFDNFIKDTTPFTKENTDYVFKIAVYLLAVKIACLCFALVGLFTKCFVSINIITIVAMFAVYYIFKYATSMQEIANTKICD